MKAISTHSFLMMWYIFKKKLNSTTEVVEFNFHCKYLTKYLVPFRERVKKVWFDLTVEITRNVVTKYKDQSPLDWNSPCRGEGASHQEVSTRVRQREELNWASQLKSSDQQIFSSMSGTDSLLIRQD